ncbi:hypothetical protein [Kitasatospora sp. MMS16-BH015]|uniref:hypothetical protein n=1 Tax=Kitasatospora sp. MMS16-BH015 TaxID=2018025 RepID=UPI000CF2BA21|nr:hypothetical protein [Kitasatospora sp. MMS16-BH015]
MKLRPGAHFVPSARGLYCSRAGRSFVLPVPPAVQRLLDDRLGDLTDGAEVASLLGPIDDPTELATLRQALATLLSQGLLFDLDRAGGLVPDRATAERYADALAHLEEHCAEPYAAFAALRAARVAVLGEGPAAVSAVRGLRSLGLAAVTDTLGPRTTAAVIAADTPEELAKLAALLPPELPYLPVAAGDGHHLVGPVLRGLPSALAFPATADRVAAWAGVHPAGHAPSLHAATLAGSLAARTLLDLLATTGLDTSRLTVIHGRTLRTTTRPAPTQAPGPTWLPIDPTARPATPTGHTAQPPERPTEPAAGPARPTEGTAKPAAGPARPTDTPTPPVTSPAPSSPTTAEGTAAAPEERLTEEWYGLARWLDESALSQLPFRLAALEAVALPGRPVLTGWGTDPADARRDALLRLLRATAAAAAEPDAPHPGTAAAGTTRPRWLLDGLLRILAEELPTDLAAPEWSELPPSEPATPRARSLRRALTQYFGHPARLHSHTLPGTSWTLATVTDTATGERLATQWGPSVQAAGQAALARALAGRQQEGTALATAAVGTRALEWARPAELAALAAALHAPEVLRGRSVHAHLLTEDPVLGPLPFPCGLIRLATPPTARPTAPYPEAL